MPDVIEPVTMPASLDALEACLDALEQMQRALGAGVRKAARSLVGSSRELLDQWASLCKEVAAGQTKKVLDQRGPFLTRVAARVSALKRTHNLVRELNHGASEADELLSDIAALEKLHAKLSRRWTDEEGLEYLAVEALMPSKEKLESLAAKSPPPQSWYDETDDPFQE